MKSHCLGGCLIAVSMAPAVAADLEVPGDFDRIQAAVNAAAAGDTVLIAPGTYSENIELRSDITVRGRETARTLLGPAQQGATVTIREVSGATLANLTIVDSTIGVLVIGSTDVLISNVVFDSATDAAVDLDASPAVDIENNVFFSNARAIRRLTGDSSIVNNLFVGNTLTIVSELGFIANNVEFNGFFDNDDLRQGEIDTGLGINRQVGDPSFVDSSIGDFHLRSGSIAIDAGTGTDGIDDTVADLGAYGGLEADAIPYPVSGVAVSDASAASPPPYSVHVSWDANEDYRITSATLPGSYRVYYRRNGSGPPYEGTDAGGGTRPSPVEVGTGTTYVLEDLTPQVDTPAVPQLLTAETRNEAVALTWSETPGAEGYRVSYGQTSTSETAIDVGNSTRTTVTGLVNGTTYRFAVAAMRRPAYAIAVTAVDGTTNHNESEYSDEQRITIGPPAVSALSNELTATPEVTTPVPDLPDKGCFVATAAYGADWQPQVEILRDFRDRYLLETGVGRSFVSWYYEHGPHAAAWLHEHASWRPLVRALFAPVVYGALLLLAMTPQQGMALGMVLLAGIVAARARERRAGEAA